MSPDANGPEDRLRLANARASVPWQPVIEKILTHLGLQARAPPRSTPAVKRCKRLDEPDSSLFMWPGVQGSCRDRLRPRLAGSVKMTPVSVFTRSKPPLTAASGRRCRRCPGRSRLQRPHQLQSSSQEQYQPGSSGAKKGRLNSLSSRPPTEPHLFFKISVEFLYALFRNFLFELTN